MKKLLVIVMTAMMAVSAVSTQAAIVYWASTGLGGTADYADGNSWTDDWATPYGSIPLSTDSHGLITIVGGVTQPIISSAIAQAPAMLGIGWDIGYGELNMVAGGSITANDMIMGFDGNNPAEGVLNISGGTMVIGGTLSVGWVSSTGTVNQSGGILHLALPPTFNHGVINLSDTAFFLINGDQTGLGLVSNGWVTTAPPETVSEVYNSGDGLTEYTVIPEPAFLGFIALGALALIRRK
jgi:hypothetical protein